MRFPRFKQSIRLHLKKLFARKGQTLVEYSLILALLGVVFIAAFSMLGNQIIVVFSAITALLDSAQASGF